MDTRRAFAIVVVALIITVAATPLISEESEAESVAVPVQPLAIGAVGGFFIGLTVGIALGILIDDPSEPAADQEEVYRQCRDLYSQLMVSNWDTAKNLISSVMPADTSLWAFTTNYWNRATELAVAEWWTLGSGYDPNLMIEESLLRQNVMNYIYDWQAAIDNAYNNILSKNSELTGDCYGDMKLSIDWDGGAIVPGGGNRIHIDLLQTILNTSSGQTVYIDTSDEDDGANYNPSTSGTLYAFGNDVELTYIGGGIGTGEKYTVTNGHPVDVTSWPSGLYRIDGSGAVLAGPLSMAVDADAAEVIGSMIVTTGSDTVMFYPGGEGVLNVRHDGVTTVTGTLTLSIDYTGNDANHRESILLGTSDRGESYDIVGGWNDMIQAIDTVIMQAGQAGQVIWDVFDAAEESNSFVSPSSVTMTIPGVTLTASQAEAVTVQAMMQIADYWERNEGEIVDADFSTDAESLSVYVYGDIYLNDQLWVENAVITPYMAMDEQHLEAGQRIEWDGPGFAMMWAQVDDFDDFDPSSVMDSANYELLDMSEGYIIDVKAIVQDGEEIQSLILKPIMVLRDTAGSDDPGDPPEPVKVMDAGMLIMIILLILALCVFLVFYIMDMPVAGLVLALIIAVVGLGFSGTIASLFLGTFEWSWP